MNVLERALLFAAAICLITPETITSVVGVILGVAVLFLNTARKKKTAKAA